MQDYNCSLHCVLIMLISDPSLIWPQKTREVTQRQEAKNGTSVRVAIASLSGGRCGFWQTRDMRRSNSWRRLRLGGGSKRQLTWRASVATSCSCNRPAEIRGEMSPATEGQTYRLNKMNTSSFFSVAVHKCQTWTHIVKHSLRMLTKTSYRWYVSRGSLSLWK